MLIVLLFTVPSTFITWVLMQDCPHMWVPITTFILCAILTVYIEAHTKPKSSIMDKWASETRSEMEQQRDKLRER